MNFRLILLVLSLALPSVFGWAQSWREKGDEHLKVFYHFGEEKNVAGLLQAVNRTLPDLEAKLGVMLEHPARIYLASSQEEFDRISGRSLPDWSQGASFPETGSIILKSPRFSQDISAFHQTAIHELVHLLVALKAGPAVPRWLTEGLALLFSGEGSGKPLLPLSRALWADKIIPLGEIEQVDLLPHIGAELAYIESFQAVQFIVQEFGWGSLSRILTAMGQGKSWDEALYGETALDGAGFEAAWLKNLEKSYRWLFLLNVQNLIFASFVLLVLAAFIAMRRRRRRILRQWESEDARGQGIL